MTVLTVSNARLKSLAGFSRRHHIRLLTLALAFLSVVLYIYYFANGRSLAYNDARSHLNIGRRVVEGLKPGLAQLGSVWLPLPHLLMVPTIWQDFMWHSGLAGALQSMISFVATGLLIYKFLSRLHVGAVGRLVGVGLFVANLNVLYMQSTAMTELLLLATMTAGCYFLLVWHQTDNLTDLIKSGFFIMLSTAVRYDGWFLLVFVTALIFIRRLIRQGWTVAEGTSILFATLAGFGVALWFGWNLLIFKDPLYFAYGPYSAHTQQASLADAGDLRTQGNLPLSVKTYLYALLYNSYTFPALLSAAGLVLLLSDSRISGSSRLASTTLVAPLAFNVLALYLGHSVLFVQGVSGNTWFNVRYGMMLIPSIAIFTGYLVHRLPQFKWTIIGLLAFVSALALANGDAVTIDDGLYGSSQKNVTQVATVLKDRVPGSPGFVLISAASHDAIIFSSGLPMKRIIHEGTGAYWESATVAPDRWARWIVMRTYDDNDATWRLVSKSPGFAKYNLIDHFEFADVYEVQPEYIPQLTTTPVFTRQK